MTTLQTAGAAMEALESAKQTIARMGVEIERKNALLARALDNIKILSRCANIDHKQSDVEVAITKELT